MKYFVFIFTLCAITSCCASKSNKNQKLMQKTIPQTYTIHQIFDQQITDDKVTLTLNFTENTLSGYSGCNAFSGSFSLEENQITFGPIASTKKMCPEINNESMLYKAFENTQELKLDANTLVLMDRNGNTLVKAISKTKEQTMNQDKITFEYKAVSRGFYLNVYLSNVENILLVTTHPDMKPSKQTYSTEAWNALVAEMKKIDLKSLDSIEAPSKSHQYDGAAIAYVKIEVNNNTYKTMAFDHGNPPEEINTLVKILLSFAE